MKSHLKRVHRQRKAGTRARVMRALALLEKRGEAVTFSSVSRVSGVSRPTLYNNPDIRAAISRVREEQADSARIYRDSIVALRAENRKLQRKVDTQRTWIEVLNDKGPVLRDEDLRW